MARVNITIPDDLVDQARTRGINISATAAAGLRDELDRLDKVDLFEAYVDELDEELGPPSAEELARAEAWVEEAFGAAAAAAAAAEAKKARGGRKSA